MADGGRRDLTVRGRYADSPCGAFSVEPCRGDEVASFEFEKREGIKLTFTPFFVQATGTDPSHQLTDAFYSTAGS